MAFRGYDNVETFTVAKTGDEGWTLQSAGFTSAKIVVEGAEVEAQISGNDVSAVLGDLNLPYGNYEGKVVVFSSIYEDGLVIVGPGLPESLDVHVRD